MIRSLILFVFLIVVVSHSFAQENTYQTWLDYDHHFKKSGNWQFFSDYGFRWQSVAGKDNWYRIHARPSVGFKPNTLMNYSGGVGLFFTDNKTASDQLELRPWQGVTISWPTIKRLRFYNFFRLEERFAIRSNQTENFVLKLRYKLGVKIPLNNEVISVRTFYIPASIELFFDVTTQNNEQNNDRTRIEIGLGYRWTAKTTVQLLYTLQSIYNNQNYGIDFSEGFRQIDQIVRLSVSQRFGYE